MEIREYWRLLRRRAWIPLALVAVSVAAATGLAFLTKPQYVAAATISTAGGGRLTFPEVVSSNTLALRIRRDLNLDQSVGQLQGRIRVAFVRANLYRLSVTDSDAQRAVTLANTAAREAAALTDELAANNPNPAADPQKSHGTFLDQYLAAAKALLSFNRDHPEATTVTVTSRPKDVDLAARALQLQLNERAAAQAYLDFEAELSHNQVQQLSSAGYYGATVVDEAAAQPDTASRFQIIAYAGALAFMLGIGLIFLLEYFDNSIRQPEQVEELVGTPVVGVIPRGKARTLRQAKGGAA